ncbi:MAG: hypothetical protein GTO45_31195 [Candidatus Aminicenantes bacterium]|nr:hypothetical protein [Candidatus Aminicenantes bacterium]NIM83265.1 hypothetical protein [Candidatus Aminicenantes bacterium]NIN22636.1 hypothetical protein [Candidatus Aminicenantes bacterium]NIN46395.1 hypothetical protein [Candidatus Aminicenantes bacterium]NIN89245.1 hypothetical protein [Candidatus Aminicenantes bacterium]
MNRRYILSIFLIVGLLSVMVIPVQAATITVDTLVDENDGVGVGTGTSLRDAIAAASPGDTIDFSVTGTSYLTLGQLIININLTITGPGASNLTIDGNNASRIFYINNSAATVNISGLTVTNTSLPGNFLLVLVAAEIIELIGTVMFIYQVNIPG